MIDTAPTEYHYGHQKSVGRSGSASARLGLISIV
jgi:hypothetical protein